MVLSVPSSTLQPVVPSVSYSTEWFLPRRLKPVVRSVPAVPTLVVTKEKNYI